MFRKQLIQWANWFFLGNAILFWVVGIYYLSNITPLVLAEPTLTHHILVWIFLTTALLGHMSLLAFFAYIFLLLPLLYLLPKPRLITLLAILIASFIAIWLVIDSIVFAKTRFHINGILLEMALSPYVQDVFNFSWFEWLQAACLSATIFAIEIFLGLAAWRWVKAQRFLRYQNMLLTLLFCCLFIAYDIFLLAASKTNLSLTQQARAFPLFNNVMASILPINNSTTRIENLGAAYFAQPQQATYKLRYPLQALSSKPTEQPLNIVMIVIDSWRFDMLNPYVTPVINHFAQSVWQFNQHISGGNSTLKGMFSLFYALPGTYWPSMLEEKRGPVFFQELLKQNYRIGIFASAGLEEPPLYNTIFKGVPNLNLKPLGANPFQRDQTITQQFQHFLATQTIYKRPFFSLLFYDAAHSYCGLGNPIQLFQPSPTVCNHVILSNKIDPKPYLNRYKNALYFVDQQVAQILADLKARKLLANTVVVITGDHGQEFNDNRLNFWEHSTNYTRYQIQTPLLIYWPGKKPLHINHLTSHYDVVPFLMANVLGIKNPLSDYSIGKPLFSDKNRPYMIISSYTNFGIVENDRITNIFATGNFQITDLRARELPNAVLRLDIADLALKDLKRFYR